MKIKKSIVVNSLGEVCDELLSGDCVVGSVTRSEAILAYDPHLTHDSKQLSEASIDRRERNAVDQAFHAQLHACRALNYDTCQWIEYIWDIQKLNDAHVRIWAREGKIWMSIEFRECTDTDTCKLWWQFLKSKVKQNKLTMWTMDEACVIQPDWKPAGKGKFKADKLKVPERSERQVSIDAVVPYKASITWVGQKKRWLLKLFEKEFRAAGIGVI